MRESPSKEEAPDGLPPSPQVEETLVSSQPNVQEMAAASDIGKVSEVTTGQSLTPLLQTPPLPPSSELDVFTPSPSSSKELTSTSTSHQDYAASALQSTTSETSLSDDLGLGVGVVNSSPIKTSSPVEMSQETPTSLPTPLPLPSSGSSQHSENAKPRLHHHLTLRGAEPLSSSLQSLPSSFSPRALPNGQAPLNFLGYNPMMVHRYMLSV